MDNHLKLGNLEIRDIFAAFVIQGIVTYNGKDYAYIENNCDYAYKVADQMMKARCNPSTPADGT